MKTHDKISTIIPKWSNGLCLIHRLVPATFDGKHQQRLMALQHDGGDGVRHRAGTDERSDSSWRRSRFAAGATAVAASLALGCGFGLPENPDFLPTTRCLATLSLTTEGEQPITSKDEYVAGRASLAPLDGSDPCVLSETTMRIKGRGNTSWSMPKKPYTLKLDEAAPLCGMPASKHWVLLANYVDKTLMRNQIAFALGERFGLAHTPKSHFVELYLNGQYEGVYQLTEKIEAGTNRIDLAGGGFLLEGDDRTQDEVGFVTERGTDFLVHEPSEATPAEIQTIKQYIEAVEGTLYSDGLADSENGAAKYLDLPSFIRWGLVNELFRNVDATFHSSCWLYKPPEDKLYMGPLWDFELGAANVGCDSCRDPDGWRVFDAAWLKQMFKDPNFRQAVADTWNERKAERIDTVPALIDSTAEYLSCAQENNFQRWPILGTRVWPDTHVAGTYQGEVEFLRDWLSDRIAWMDEQLNDGAPSALANSR